MCANVGNLHLALAFERVGGKNRVQQNVGEQIEAGRKIAAHGFQVDAEAVIAAVAVNAAADRLDFCRNVPGAATRRAFEQHPAGQLGDAVVVPGFGEHAAFEHGAKFDKGEAMIFLHEQAQAVRQFKFPDRVLVFFFDGHGQFGRGAIGQQRVKCAVFRREIFTRDAQDVIGPDALDGGEATFGKIQIICRQPVCTEVLRLAFHRLAHGQRGGNELFHRFAEFAGGNRRRLHFFNLGQHRVTRRGEFVRVHDGAHAEQTRIAGAVSPRVHVVDDALFLADLLVEARTAAATEQNGEHVERRHIGMPQFGNVPGKMKMTEFNGRFLDDFTRCGLLRFFRQHD